MFHLHTLKILALLVLLYFLLLLPGFFAPAYLDSPMGILLVAPLLSIYLFQKLGIPGLVEQNGLCGWGWCPPTPVGWLLAAMVWLIPIWLIAWGIGSMSTGRARG